MSSQIFRIKTIIFTAMALVAFAANSVLCRMALGDGSIDAAGFTVIRLLSGVIVLLAIATIRNHNTSLSVKGSWVSACMLFLYAVTFSFAYISLDTGTGALILFGAVQITMILASILSGYRLHAAEWVGVILAFAGFVYLILPGVTAPSTSGFVLMSAAGIAWGIYTVRGHASRYPLLDTAWNFARTIPLLILLLVFTIKSFHISTEGALLAVLSGGIASGVGYAIWYNALGGLTTTQAAAVQLAVPVIAALAGVVMLSEAVTLRLAISAAMILGGILMVVLGKRFYSLVSG